MSSNRGLNKSKCNAATLKPRDITIPRNFRSYFYNLPPEIQEQIESYVLSDIDSLNKLYNRRNIIYDNELKKLKITDESVKWVKDLNELLTDNTIKLIKREKKLVLLVSIYKVLINIFKGIKSYLNDVSNLYLVYRRPSNWGRFGRPFGPSGTSGFEAPNISETEEHKNFKELLLNLSITLNILKLSCISTKDIKKLEESLTNYDTLLYLGKSKGLSAKIVDCLKKDINKLKKGKSLSLKRSSRNNFSTRKIRSI